MFMLKKTTQALLNITKSSSKQILFRDC